MSKPLWKTGFIEVPISQLLDGLSFEDVEFILAKIQDDLPRGAVYHGIVFSPS